MLALCARSRSLSLAASACATSTGTSLTIFSCTTQKSGWSLESQTRTSERFIYAHKSMFVPCWNVVSSAHLPHAGKYSMDNLPKGPRGVLFKQLLPEIQPLLATLEAIAKSRRKTMSQVRFLLQPGASMLATRCRFRLSVG